MGVCTKHSKIEPIGAVVLNQVFSFCPPSGRAIKHVKESIFTTEAGARRGVPKVLVVLTDGRSQDDVNKVSKEMQMEGGYLIYQTQKLNDLLFVEVLGKSGNYS